MRCPCPSARAVRRRLRNMKVMLGWGDTVTVVSSDMRDWTPPEMADILVRCDSWGGRHLAACA